MRSLLTIFVIFFVFVSCKEEDEIEQKISKIELDVLVERFDRAFANATPKDLPQLKNAFPFLFSEKVPDSVWINRMNDTLQEQLLFEVDKTFGDFSNTEDELFRLFQHLKYYDQMFTVPRVITLTNDVEYRTSVIVTDTIVLIALDNYLGSAHEFYGNIPKYKTQNMKPSQIIPDLAQTYAQKHIFQSQQKTLLDDMVYFGKQLYFMDRVIPFRSDETKIGYTEEQLEFAKANEDQIWTYFIENEYLYSTDRSLPGRFIADAPFSKFYLQLDRESPGRLGQYIGWQIVRAYMEKNEVPLMEMLKKDAVEIFNKSNYKPPK
ncbi:gliding motility lipoprotein GldB [Psychroserpens sp. XS_ASV72]|uniref:gliding motility lipoprotein GldB n=1 Tax=Psychroserpens sp. XS_ASV72 TaxID=3241293 RepID=UPI00351416ED